MDPTLGSCWTQYTKDMVSLRKVVGSYGSYNGILLNAMHKTYGFHNEIGRILWILHDGSSWMQNRQHMVSLKKWVGSYGSY